MSQQLPPIKEKTLDEEIAERRDYTWHFIDRNKGKIKNHFTKVFLSDYDNGKMGGRITIKTIIDYLISIAEDDEKNKLRFQHINVFSELENLFNDQAIKFERSKSLSNTLTYRFFI